MVPEQQPFGAAWHMEQAAIKIGESHAFADSLHHGRRLWDLSQTPETAPRFEVKESLMTLLTNTVAWSTRKQRALSPIEALVAHGIPALPEVTPSGLRTWQFPVAESAKRQMAGMSMHVPSVAAVMLAAMVFVQTA